MKDPTIVAVASVIPGLGFALQEKYRQALLCFLGIASLLGIFLFSPIEWEFVGQLSCTLLILAWALQGYLAFESARRDRRIEQGKTAAARTVTSLSPAPAHLSRGERQMYVVRQTLEQQALPGEHLSEVLQATSMPSAASHVLFGAAAIASMKQYYMGLTPDGLLLLSLDLWGKPAEVTRIKKTQIQRASFRKGWLNGTLEIRVEGGSPLRVTVPRFQTEAGRRIADALSMGAD